jgi:hypothetical protein
MTFDEMQLIMQSIAVNQLALQTTQSDMQSTQRSMQAIFDEMQVNQREIQATMQETQQIVRSIARGVQAMQEKALTDELKREEEKAAAAQRTLEHEQRMQRLEDISAGLIRLYGSLDEDRPTVFRALNAIDRKVDNILDRFPPVN